MDAYEAKNGNFLDEMNVMNDFNEEVFQHDKAKKKQPPGPRRRHGEQSDKRVAPYASHLGRIQAEQWAAANAGDYDRVATTLDGMEELFV
ncbi:hypothetical protein LTR22_024398 [Elasticomyces elasticus]|nr:hypothetical protein LTR22_024398 [Elasticomyces elasticus]